MSIGESAVFMTYEARPVLRCAVCEKPILIAREAVVVYPRGIEPGEMRPVRLTHKGDCQQLAQTDVANPHGRGLVMELTEYGARLRGKTEGSAEDFP